MSKNWVLDTTLQEFVAEEANANLDVAKGVVDLFEQGHEVAYIVRYRVDVHRGLTCDQVRQAFKSYQDAKELNNKAEKALKTIQSKVPLEDREWIEKQLKQSQELSDVQEITKTYSTGKKTKTDKARSLGLLEVAEKILVGETMNLSRSIDKKNADISTLEKIEENVQILMADMLNRLPETTAICQKITSLEEDIYATVKCELSTKAKKLKEDDKNFPLIAHFSNYVSFEKPLKYTENYQVLAMDRGEEQDILTWNILFKGVERLHPSHAIKVSRNHLDLFKRASSYSIQHQFIPRLQRGIKRNLRRRAEAAAIDCFSKNLSQLFSLSAMNGSHVAALDPGFSACKSAFLNPEGSVLETTEFGLRGKNFDEKGVKVLTEWAKRSVSRLIIAIGNGKASLETQMAVASLISSRKFGACDVKFCVVSECGASKYSITPLAEEELPGMKVTHRSAVSIGRRLIDPLSEYVKIEPKHLGLGMYQHSVNEKRLSEALELVVRECVSLRGVDVNSASLQLLQHICGLNKKSAAGIIAYRDDIGRISSRDELKNIKGLGPKSFEQCAGFLRISRSDKSEPPAKKRKKVDSIIACLENTTVHPKLYKAAQRLLERLKLPDQDNLSSNTLQRLKAVECETEEENLVVSLLTDPQPLTPPPPLLTEIRRVASIEKGEKIMGCVRNHAEFGIFVDIGAECNALAHRSCLRKPYPEVGTQIWVQIDSIDLQRKRIGIQLLHN